MCAASTLRELRRCAPHGSLPPCGGGNAVAPVCPTADQHSRRCVHALARKRGPRTWRRSSAERVEDARERAYGPWVPASAGTNGDWFNGGAKLIHPALVGQLQVAVVLEHLGPALAF